MAFKRLKIVLFGRKLTQNFPFWSQRDSLNQKPELVRKPSVPFASSLIHIPQKYRFKFIFIHVTNISRWYFSFPSIFLCDCMSKKFIIIIIFIVYIPFSLQTKNFSFVYTGSAICDGEGRQKSYGKCTIWRFLHRFAPWHCKANWFSIHNKISAGSDVWRIWPRNETMEWDCTWVNWEGKNFHCLKWNFWYEDLLTVTESRFGGRFYDDQLRARKCHWLHEALHELGHRNLV